METGSVSISSECVEVPESGGARHALLTWPFFKVRPTPTLGELPGKIIPGESGPGAHSRGASGGRGCLPGDDLTWGRVPGDSGDLPGDDLLEHRPGKCPGEQRCLPRG